VKKRRQVLDLSVFLLAVFAFILTFLAVAWNNAAAECVEEHHGDLIIGANEVLTISDEMFCIDGNIIIEANGHLVVRNATLITKARETQWAANWTALRVGEGGRLELLDVVLVAEMGCGIWIDTASNARVEITNVSLREASLGIGVSENAHAAITNSSVGDARIAEGGVLEIQDSVVSELHLYFRGLSPKLIEDLVPGQFGSWEFILDKDLGSYLSLRETTVQAWAIGVAGVADVTLENSTLQRVHIMLGQATGRISNVYPGYFNRWELQGPGKLDCNLNLRLINSHVTESWLIDFSGRADVTISDSTIDRIRIGWTYADLDLQGVDLGGLEMENGVGKIYFEGVYISGGMYFVNAMLTLEGGLSILPTAHIDDFRYSNVIRTYMVVVRTEDGSPAAGALVELESPEGRRLSARTDDNGTTSFTIPFNDSNYSERWTLTVIFGGQTVVRNIGFMSSSPIPVQILNAYNTTRNGS